MSKLKTLGLRVPTQLARLAAAQGASWSDPHRGSRHVRGYGTAWDKLRIQILKRDCYVCQCTECSASNRVRPATEVDHLTPKARGGTDDPSNLRAINRECHRRKTVADSHGGSDEQKRSRRRRTAHEDTQGIKPSFDIGALMASGGYRPGAGKPKGSKNKRPGSAQGNDTVAPPSAPVSAGLTRLEHMLAIMNDPKADPASRARMAIAAAPVVHQRSIEPGKNEMKAKAAKSAAHIGAININVPEGTSRASAGQIASEMARRLKIAESRHR